MKQVLKFSQRCLLLTTSLLASSILFNAPSRAATFAFSEGVLELNNFSQSPSSKFTNTDTNTISTSQGGTVAATADAIAFLKTTPPLALNSTSSLATGKNGDYKGIAESEAIVTGIFDLPENTWFSFNFTGELNTQVKNASAFNNISFALVDIANQDVLDFFHIAGNLTTKDSQDFLHHQKSNNVTLNNLSTYSDFTGEQKSAKAYFNGSTKLYFTNRTSLALVAVNRSQARVSVPESSNCIGLIFSCGVVAIFLKRKRQLHHKLPTTQKLASEA